LAAILRLAPVNTTVGCERWLRFLVATAPAWTAARRPGSQASSAPAGSRARWARKT